ncbi:MAG: hypothetical protein O3C43_23915 [Verrucomicrobia bacterium]|nr:hypothetical protein [Verrucomicrobiota bacterium]
MKWAKFKHLPRNEKLLSRRKLGKFIHRYEKFRKDVKTSGYEPPNENKDFNLCVVAWCEYRNADTMEKMIDYLDQIVECDGAKGRAPNVALGYARWWPEFFFGFPNPDGKGGFVPGFISVIMQDFADDPIEEYLLYTDLSKMTLDHVVDELFKLGIKTSHAVVRQRVSVWDRLP